MMQQQQQIQRQQHYQQQAAAATTYRHMMVGHAPPASSASTPQSRPGQQQSVMATSTTTTTPAAGVTPQSQMAAATAAWGPMLSLVQSRFSQLSQISTRGGFKLEREIDLHQIYQTPFRSVDDVDARLRLFFQDSEHERRLQEARNHGPLVATPYTNRITSAHCIFSQRRPL